jgi:hypothetical protein
MVRDRRDAGADGHGEPFRVAELDVDLLEARAEPIDGSLELRHLRPDDEELVGPVACDVPLA